MTIKLKINGLNREVDPTPGTPLLWVLRDSLGLKGTKFGCGSGLCGACTVHLNNEAVRSCVLPVEAAQNAEVLTIEGLAETEMAEVQAAWIDVDVPQCGYCQPGMQMSVAAILKKQPDLSAAQVCKSLTNICRCGTYDRITEAVERLFPA